MDHSQADASDSKPRWSEALAYIVGAVLVLLGAYVWIVRARAGGDWTLRMSQLWDSIGLISLGLAVVAIGLTLTILRVQNREALRTEQEMLLRQDQHKEVLRRIESISEQTHTAVSETGQDVKKVLAAQIQSARVASRAEPEPYPVDKAVSDELDEISLEGVREGDISNLPLDTHLLSDERLLHEVITLEGVFYPVGVVPIGVLADVFEGWEAAYPKSKERWQVGSLVGAYRSYSVSAIEGGQRNLRGAPWFVVFRRSDDSLVTYYLSRTGRKRLGSDEKRPVVKRLVGDGAEARWEPLGDGGVGPSGIGRRG